MSNEWLVPLSTAAYCPNASSLLARDVVETGPSYEVKHSEDATSQVDTESKYDSAENTNPWVSVSRRLKKAAAPSRATKTPQKPVRRVWRETAESKLERAEAAKIAERRQAFAKSYSSGRKWDRVPESTRPVLEAKEEKEEVVTPNETAVKKPYEAKRSPKSARRHLRKVANRLGVSELPPPVKEVSKSEAASPVQVQTAIVPNVPAAEENIEDEDDAPRGSGDVIFHKERGTNLVYQNASRLLTVKYKKYRIVQSHLFGVARKYMSDDEIQPIIGFLYNSDEVKEVLLPSTIVQEFASFWVTQSPGTATYKRYMLHVERICYKIDFDTPEIEFDVKLYGAYLGWTYRMNERADMARRVRGNVLTRFGQGCLGIGLALAASASIPVAAAASTVATLAPSTTLGVGAAAFSVGALLVGAAIKAAMPWMAHDMAVEEALPVPSTVATAPPPKQKEDAVFTVLEAKKHPEAVRPEAAFPTGISVPGYEPVVFASNQVNLVAALQKRSFAEPAPGDRKSFLAWSRKHWEDVIGKIFDLRVPREVSEQDEMVEDWLAGSGSSPSVKARIRVAWAAMRADGFDMWSPVSSDLAHEWTKRDASVKIETLLKDESASPRQIMAAPPQYVAVIAPFVKMLTGYIRRKMKDGPLVYGPGLREEELSRMVSEREWDNRANGDFNAYDSNQGPDMGEEEIAIFGKYGLSTLGRQLMRANLQVHGASMEGVKFQAPYCRMSGDPQTTLMNTVWNLLAMAYVYCSERNIHPRGMDVLFLAGGDDSQLNYDGPRIDFESRLAALGLPATVKHVDHLNQVEFLSSRLTRTSRGWRFIPMVGKMAAKLAFSVRATKETAGPILRGGALSMIASFSSSPPGIAILRTFLRITQGVSEAMPKDEPWKMLMSNTGSATDETWDDLADQYGWDEKMQEQLEDDLSRVTKWGTTIDSGALALLMDIDCSRKDTSVEKPVDSDSAAALPPPNTGDLEATALAHNQEMHASNGNRNRRQAGRRGISAATQDRYAQMAGISLAPRAPRRGRAPPAPAMTRFPQVRRTRPMPLASGRQVGVAAAYATGQMSRKAQFTRQSADAVTITHRELVASVSGSTTFTNAFAFSVNPGLFASFPWLSSQASGWEKYRFEYLRLCYYTRNGSSTPGSVQLVPDYDAADGAPINEMIASAAYGTAEDAPWKDICLELDVRRLAGERFLRNGPLVPNLDIKTYDVANVFVNTVDGTAIPWGKLWWEYRVVLINPQLPAGGSGSYGGLQNGTSPAQGTVFGTGPISTGNFMFNPTSNIVHVAGLVINIEYVAYLTMTGTGVTAFSIASTAGLTVISTLATGANTAGTGGTAAFTFVPTSSTSISFAISATATTVAGTQLIIVPLIPAPAF